MKVAVFVLVALVAASTLVLRKAEAAEYVVGDEVGGTVPRQRNHGAAFYALWVASHKFHPGDTLVFKSPKNKKHEQLAFVSGKDYKSCNSSNAIFLYNVPYNFTIPHFPGTYRFISSIAKHCKKGQKIAIDVAHHSATTPAPQPSHHYPHVPMHPPVYAQVPPPPPIYAEVPAPSEVYTEVPTPSPADYPDTEGPPPEPLDYYEEAPAPAPILYDDEEDAPAGPAPSPNRLHLTVHTWMELKELKKLKNHEHTQVHILYIYVTYD